MQSAFGRPESSAQEIKRDKIFDLGCNFMLLLQGIPWPAPAFLLKTDNRDVANRNKIWNDGANNMLLILATSPDDVRIYSYVYY